MPLMVSVSHIPEDFVTDIEAVPALLDDVLLEVVELLPPWFVEVDVGVPAAVQEFSCQFDTEVLAL